jgi:single-strand DNA-binding protein
MANLNKVMLIGRLTRKPEEIPARNGRGAKFGFAVNNRKLYNETQLWEDVPVFIDVEVWNRGENGKMADRVLDTLDKGQQIFIEGHLKLDSWEDKNGGGKRSKLGVVIDNFQYLEARRDGNGGGDGEGGGMARAPRPAAAGVTGPRKAPAAYSNNYDDDAGGSAPSRGNSGGSGNTDDIPF